VGVFFGHAAAQYYPGRLHAADVAAAYPEAKRADAERVFAALLAAYPKFEQQLDVPAGDLAGAFALFVIASYELARTVHEAAKSYLAGLLKLDPDRVRIDDGGLSVR
jgi:uncharacterized protein DUF6683